MICKDRNLTHGFEVDHRASGFVKHRHLCFTLYFVGTRYDKGQLTMRPICKPCPSASRNTCRDICNVSPWCYNIHSLIHTHETSAFVQFCRYCCGYRLHAKVQQYANQKFCIHYRYIPWLQCTNAVDTHGRNGRTCAARHHDGRRMTTTPVCSRQGAFLGSHTQACTHWSNPLPG